jgi:flagellar biogenesis protein FliO
MLEVGFKMSVALGVVLLTFGAAVMIAKKFFGKGLPKLSGKKDASSSKGQLRIESSRMLGQGRNLHVVKFGEKMLLIGATAHTINLLCEADEEEVDNDSFESMLDSNHEETKEKTLLGQLGSRLKEISRV